jgi:hypothetical protein
MKGFTRPPWRIVESSAVWFGLIVIGSGCLGFGQANASPIRRTHRTDAVEAYLARSHSGTFHPWSAYLLGGPSLWSGVIHPRVNSGVETAIWKAIRSDRGEESPWIRFLLWKQSLNPTRFARFHPHVALALDRISAYPTQAAMLPPITPTTNPTPGSGGTGQPPTEAQQIPEPSTWLISLGMAGWGAWWHQRKRWRTLSRPLAA